MTRSGGFLTKFEVFGEAVLGLIPTGNTALKRRHEGTEMTTNDKPLTRNYDSDKEKSENRQRHSRLKN